MFLENYESAIISPPGNPYIILMKESSTCTSQNSKLFNHEFERQLKKLLQFIPYMYQVTHSLLLSSLANNTHALNVQCHFSCNRL